MAAALAFLPQPVPLIRTDPFRGSQTEVLGPTAPQRQASAGRPRVLVSGYPVTEAGDHSGDAGGAEQSRPDLTELYRAPLRAF